MLNRLARQVANSHLHRHLLFIIATLLAVSSIGYYFGTFDDVIHIPFLKNTVDPSLYPGDPFMTLRSVHYSYFWYLFQPVYKAGILEPTLFALHLVTTYAVFWMIYVLAETLFDNPLVSFMSVLAFIFPHLALPGFPVIEYSLLNRTVVLPVLLGALILYLRGRTLPAYLLVGLAADLHILSALYVVGMLLLDSLLRLRQLGWRRVLAGLGLFAAAASPVLLWKTGSVPVDFSLRPDIVDIASRTLQATIYQYVSPNPAVLLNDLSAISCLALWWIGRKARPVTAKDRVMDHFMLAVGLTQLLQAVVTYLLPVTILIQLQISRAGVFWLIFAYPYFANRLGASFQKEPVPQGGTLLSLAALILSPHPIAPWITWAVRRWLDRRAWRAVIAAFAMGLALVAAGIIGYRLNYWKPGIYIYGPDSPWKEAQLWAKANTPKNARFITPPQLVSFYIPEWRVFSERASIVSISESLEISFDPPYLQNWLARFNDLAPGAVNRFNGNASEALQVTAEAYNSLTPEDYIRLAHKYGAGYLVVSRDHPQPFQVAYSNAQYVIYDLRPDLAENRNTH